MTSRGKFIFILGGARSGKSSIAEKIAGQLGTKTLYIATAAILDEEMEKRVAEHTKRRPESWSTLEETHQVSEAIQVKGRNYEVIMVDCLTLLVSNLLLDENYPNKNSQVNSLEKEKAILNEIEKLSAAAKYSKANVIIVSNELGTGIVPANQLGRVYRDLVGWANQIAARIADEVYYTVAGLPLELKEISKKVSDRYNLSEGE